MLWCGVHHGMGGAQCRRSPCKRWLFLRRSCVRQWRNRV